MKQIPVETSARHIHLTREDINALFGRDYQLTNIKDLSQPGMFASKEKVAVINPKDKTQKIDNIRIVGPARNYTQLEVSFSDARKLGIKPEIRTSGNIKDTSSFKIIGPKGSVLKKEGLIAAKRHIHMTGQDAENLGVQNGEVVKIKVGEKGKRSLIFNDVKVRVSDNYKLTCHLDTDEANAAGISPKAHCEIIKF
ncbi:MAG: phosphate propanoyltransferase [Candidatus Moranbacteria bacterium]|nr:phosphate propanoyltransferase [Candidatus Moranbacteria bacterium]